MGSIWSKELLGSEDKGRRTLKGDIKTDVLIIGGGMAGVLTAYFLDRQGVEYTLVEGGRIGGGVTKNTTAKVTAQHGLIYANMVKKQGAEYARRYLTANLWAVERYAEMARVIDCDFERKPAYVYSLTDRKKIEDEVIALNHIGYRAKLCNTLTLPFEVKGAVSFSSQGQFNPIKFINGISKGLNIYEDTLVESVHSNTAITKNGVITANKIILATHFPMITIAGLYSLKLYQHRSYVIALENAQDVDGMYVDEAQNGMSFRNYKDLLLIGGGDHRTGEQGGNWRELRNYAKKHYPNATERFAWATQDCMSLDGIPYIGGLSNVYPDIYTATGFNKWGMTTSMVSAKLLCDMIVGNVNECETVFSPSRGIFTKQLGINAAKAVGNLLSIGGKRCTHLGCKLRWNSAEKTWDCPCHGSRYTDEGRVINNPARKGIHGR